MNNWQRASWAMGVMGWLSCGGVQTRTTLNLDPKSQPDWVNQTDSLSLRMVEAARTLQSLGLRIGAGEKRGFLAARSAAMLPVELAAQTCGLILGVTSEGLSDVDATLFSPEGLVLAEDTEPHAHPVLQVCAGEEPRTAYVQLRAEQGAGAYLVAVFVGNVRRFEHIQAILEKRPNLTAQSLPQAEHEARMNEFSEAMARRGFQRETGVLRFRLESSQSVRWPLSIKSARCYTVAAFRGQGNLQVLSLRVMRDDGELVAYDRSMDEPAALQFCPAARISWVAQLEAEQGKGEVQIVMYSGLAANVGGASALWLGTRAASLVSSVPLDEAFFKQSQELQKQGFGASHWSVRGVLGPGQAVSHSLPLPPDRCVLVLVVGGRGAGQWPWKVLSAEGKLLIEGELRNGVGSFELCGSSAAAPNIQLVASMGSGRYAVAIFSKTPEPTKRPLGSKGVRSLP